MTATAVKNPTVEISRVCANVWEEIRRNHPDVPKVAVIVGSGSENGKLVKWGHFHPGAWVLGEESVPELLIGGEGLSRGAIEVFGTLLHEAAHGIAMTREITDASNQGRYHNAEFKTLAEEVGLTVTQGKPYGWCNTAVPETAQRRYSRQLKQLRDVLGIYRREFGQVGKTRKSNNNGLVLECLCGTTFRISITGAKRAAIYCSGCGQAFQGDIPDDDIEEDEE